MDIPASVWAEGGGEDVGSRGGRGAFVSPPQSLPFLKRKEEEKERIEEKLRHMPKHRGFQKRLSKHNCFCPMLLIRNCFTNNSNHFSLRTN